MYVGNTALILLVTALLENINQISIISFSGIVATKIKWCLIIFLHSEFSGDLLFELL